MDDLAALRLLVDWGADEALSEAPIDRFARLAAPAAIGLPAGLPSTPPPPVPLPRVDAVLQAQALAAGSSTLADLHAALAGFEGCPLHAMATTTVRPDGNPAAGLVLVAEAPGAEDDRTGIAFSGAPGQTLDRVLASIGLDRSMVLLTHLVPWRPPGNRAPSDSEVQACLPFLWRLLHLARPRRLVLLGAAPAKALAGTADSIRRLRGRWLEVREPGGTQQVPGLPMLPMDQWMRSATAKRDTWADLVELRQSIDSETNGMAPLN